MTTLAWLVVADLAQGALVALVVRLVPDECLRTFRNVQPEPVKLDGLGDYARAVMAIAIALACALPLMACSYTTGPKPRATTCDSAVIRDSTGRVLGAAKVCR